MERNFVFFFNLKKNCSEYFDVKSITLFTNNIRKDKCANKKTSSK